MQQFAKSSRDLHPLKETQVALLDVFRVVKNNIQERVQHLLHIEMRVQNHMNDIVNLIQVTSVVAKEIISLFLLCSHDRFLGGFPYSSSMRQWSRQLFPDQHDTQAAWD
jgi:hypothetical protein